jgi:hypothetical protein
MVFSSKLNLRATVDAHHEADVPFFTATGENR